MNVPNDNPAGRLHAILCRARDAQQATLVRDVWANAFDISAVNEIALLHRFSELLALESEAKRLVTLIPGIEQELFLDSFPAIDGLLKIELFQQAAGSVLVKLREKATLLGLAFCAHEISKHFGEQVIQHDELEDFMTTIQDVSKQIRDSDHLDEVLKHVIITHLESIRQALLLYRIRGAKGIEEALEGTIGAIARLKDLYTSEKKAGGVLEAFEQLLRRLNEKVTWATTAKAVAVKSLELGKSIAGLLS